MGIMTLSEFRDELKFLLMNRTDTVASTSRLNRVINHAYSHLCQPEVRRHKELIHRYDVALVDGQQDYPLTRDVGSVGYDVLAVRDVTFYNATSITTTTDKFDVAPRSVHWMNSRTAPDGGRPTCYALDGTNLVLYPVPGSSEAGKYLRVNYFREPTPLSADGDTTVLGTYWDRVLLRGAQWLLEYDAGLRELAILTEQEYVKMINEKSDDYELNSEDEGNRADFITQPYF